MALKLALDPQPALNLIPVIVLLIGFIVTIVNGLTQFFTLTGEQVAIVGFVAFVLISLATFLTTIKDQV